MEDAEPLAYVSLASTLLLMLVAFAYISPGCLILTRQLLPQAP